MASAPDRTGNPVIDTKTLRSGNTINAQGQKGGPIDLSKLQAPLRRQAITRVIGLLGPYGRALAGVMQVDDMIKGLTGKSGMDVWQELVKDNNGKRPIRPTSGLMGLK